MTSNWKLIASLEPRGEGQRFFLRDGDVAEGLYICNNNWDDPDHSDDAPLRFMAEKKIRIGYISSDRPTWIHIDVPVLVEWGEGREEARCGITFKELLWMLQNSWAKPDMIEVSSEVSDDLRVMRDVFAHLPKHA